MTTTTQAARLAALCPTSRFRARHTLDVSDDELDHINRLASGKFTVDDLGMIICRGDPPATTQPDNDWRCGWTVSSEERHGPR